MSETEAVARRTDPSTSWAAARSVQGIRESQRQVLEVLRLNPDGLTDEGIFAKRAAMYPESRTSLSGCRTRRSELRDMGLVYNTGKTSRTEANRRSIIWAATYGTRAEMAEGRLRAGETTAPANHAPRTPVARPEPSSEPTGERGTHEHLPDGRLAPDPAPGGRVYYCPIHPDKALGDTHDMDLDPRYVTGKCGHKDHKGKPVIMRKD